MKIIGISGKARAGKDLLASFLAAYGWQRVAFADELKRRIQADFNLTMEHTDGKLKDVKQRELNGYSPRELMVDYGVLFRMYKPNYWCDRLWDHISKTYNDLDKVVITDVRFPNEVAYIQKFWGNVVRLERHSSRTKLVDPDVLNSPSENVLDNYTGFTAILPAEQNIVPEDLRAFAEQLNRLSEKAHLPEVV